MTSASIDFAQAFRSSIISVNQISSDSTYRIAISDSSSSALYRFDKTTSTTLDYYVATNGVTISPIELIKQ